MKVSNMCTPVNGTAAVVVSQSNTSDELTIEQKRENLARRLQQLQRHIASLPKKHAYRKELGLEKYRLQSEITMINEKIKSKNVLDRDLDKYILRECRNQMRSSEWEIILKRARLAQKQDLQRAGEQISE